MNSKDADPQKPGQPQGAVPFSRDWNPQAPQPPAWPGQQPPVPPRPQPPGVPGAPSSPGGQQFPPPGPPPTQPPPAAQYPMYHGPVQPMPGPGPAQAGPPPGWIQGPTHTTSTPLRNQRWWLIGGIAAVVIALVVVLAIWVVPWPGGSPTPNGSPTSSSTPHDPGPQLPEPKDPAPVSPITKQFTVAGVADGFLDNNYLNGWEEKKVNVPDQNAQLIGRSADGKILAVQAGRFIYGVNLENGENVWQHQRVTCDHILWQGSLICFKTDFKTKTSSVEALDISSGEAKTTWTNIATSGLLRLIGYDDQQLYLHGTSVDKQDTLLFALKLDGSIAWNASLDRKTFLKPYLTADNTIALVGDDGTLRVIDRSTGQEKVNRNLGVDPASVNLLADGYTIKGDTYSWDGTSHGKGHSGIVKPYSRVLRSISIADAKEAAEKRIRDPLVDESGKVWYIHDYRAGIINAEKGEPLGFEGDFNSMSKDGRVVLGENESTLAIIDGVEGKHLAGVTLLKGQRIKVIGGIIVIETLKNTGELTLLAPRQG